MRTVEYSRTYPQNKGNLSPIDVYNRFLDDEILELIVLETNRFATQILQQKRHSRSSRINKWRPTNKVEMRKFFGIVMYMGIVKYPKISDYWRNHIFYKQSVVSKVMSRNRFQLLLQLIHFADNETGDKENRLYKISNIIEKFQKKCSNECVPGETVAIDETMIPFRGRLHFRQYIPSKRHRYGVKLFKLCDPNGYTYRLSVYTGQNFTNLDKNRGLAEKVVLQLLNDYLNIGRTVITDNFYTSIYLAKSLLAAKTHLLGTLRKNRRGLPKDIVSAKIKKGEIIGKESTEGVVVAKWQDKREVLFLTTKHDIEMKLTGKKNRNGEETKKPSAIIEYNAGKDGIDLSDQMGSYFSPLRKTIKWYHKVMFELLLNTAVVNSLVIFNFFSNKKIQISEFRERLALSLLQLEEQPEENPADRHFLQTTDQRGSDNRKKRSRCVACYAEATRQGGRKEAMKKSKFVSTLCFKCNKFLCLECFTKLH